MATREPLTRLAGALLGRGANQIDMAEHSKCDWPPVLDSDRKKAEVAVLEPATFKATEAERSQDRVALTKVIFVPMPVTFGIGIREESKTEQYDGP